MELEAKAMEASNFCGSGKSVLLPLWPFLSNVENLIVKQFFFVSLRRNFYIKRRKLDCTVIFFVNLRQ